MPPSPNIIKNFRIRNSGTLEQQAIARGEAGSSRFKPYRKPSQQRGANNGWLIGNGLPVELFIQGTPGTTQYRRSRQQLFAEGLDKATADAALEADALFQIQQAEADVTAAGLEPTDERVASLSVGRIVNTTGEDPIQNPNFRQALINNDIVGAGEVVGDPTAVVSAARTPESSADFEAQANTGVPGFAANPNFDSSNIAGFTRSEPPPTNVVPITPAELGEPVNTVPVTASEQGPPANVVPVTPAEQTAQADEAVIQATVNTPAQTTAAAESSGLDLTNPEQRAIVEASFRGAYDNNQIDLTGEIAAERQQIEDAAALQAARSQQDLTFAQAGLARSAADGIRTGTAFNNLDTIGASPGVPTDLSNLASIRGIGQGTSLVTPGQIKSLINQQNRTSDILDAHREFLSPAGQVQLDLTARHQAVEDYNRQLQLQGRTDKYTVQDTLDAETRTQGTLASLDRNQLLNTPLTTIQELNDGERLVNNIAEADAALQATQNLLNSPLQRDVLNGIRTTAGDDMTDLFRARRDE